MFNIDIYLKVVSEVVKIVWDRVQLFLILKEHSQYGSKTVGKAFSEVFFVELSQNDRK